MKEYIHTYMNGEPEVLKEGTVKRHICCDCGLVHELHIVRVRKGKAIIVWFRNDYLTKKERKKNKPRVKNK